MVIRYITHTTDLSSIGPTRHKVEGKIVTLTNIMEKLQKVATKDDVVQIKGTLVAQSAEIQQLRGELDKHHDRIKVLEEQAGERAAADIHRTRPRLDVDSSNLDKYGRAQAVVD